jgi:hypothetical protein
MRVIFAFLLLVSGPALAETFCIKPLQYPGLSSFQATDIALSMASDRQSQPGFPTLLVEGGAGDPVMTVRDDRTEPLGDVFPQGPVPIFTPVRKDGSVYGWNQFGFGQEFILYRLPAGARSFVAVPDTGNVLLAAHDPAEDRLTLLRHDGVLMDMTDTGPVPSALNPLPVIGANVVLPILVPEAGAYLMVVDDQLWARPQDAAAGTAWVRIDHGPPTIWGYELGARPWHVFAAERTLAVPVGQEVFVFDTTAPGAPKYLYRVQDTGMAGLPGRPLLIWQYQGRPGLVAKLLGNEKLDYLPVLKVLGRDGPAAPPGDVPSSFYPLLPNGLESGLSETGMIKLPEFDAVLVRGPQGWFAYRDGRMDLQTQIDPAEIPPLSQVWRFNGHVLVARNGGMSEIGADLSLTPLPLPRDMRSDEFIWMYPSPAAGGAVILVGGRAWTTSDGRDLTPVKFPPRTLLNEVGADLPDRRAVFVALNTGPGLLQPCP